MLKCSPLRQLLLISPKQNNGQIPLPSPVCPAALEANHLFVKTRFTCFHDSLEAVRSW